MTEKSFLGDVVKIFDYDIFLGIGCFIQFRHKNEWRIGIFTAKHVLKSRGSDLPLDQISIQRLDRQEILIENPNARFDSNGDGVFLTWARTEIFKNYFLDVAPFEVSLRNPKHVEKLMEKLIGLLDNRNETIRIAVAEALGLMRAKAAGAISALLNCLQDASPNVKINAAEALGQIGTDPDRVVPKLIAALQDEDCRWAAARSLGHFGASAAPATEALISLLLANEEYGRYHVVEALYKIGEKAIPHLIPLLQNHDRGLNFDAVSALAGIGEKAVPYLIPLLKSQDQSVLPCVANALAGIGEKAISAVPDLIDMLQNEEVNVRYSAADALIYICKPSSPLLVSALESPHPRVREGIAYVLAMLGYKSEQVVQELISALRDENLFIDSKAIEALTKIGPDAQAAISDLTEIVRNGSEEALRELAQKAITQIKTIPLKKSE